ncbi:MAG TPA: NAD-dependent epimerase/dehydratase family protein [Burkholderiales bacterium]|nr:NAD-dependent epimerase/dehydratase family protein [Burkholderiales bacterium]
MDRLLIAGFGDIARRALPLLAPRFEVCRLSRRDGLDLDRPATLQLARADAVLHCAPPPASGETDVRTANLLAALDRAGNPPSRFVYISTSGVYGDCGGALVDESRPLNAQTGRARRRVDAERRLERWCAQRGVPLVILRAPGIYAGDRLPVERLHAGTPVLRAEDDVFTNHIHADDLAAAAARALEQDAPAGVYNISDDSEIRMGDWMDLVAEHARLPKPPRLPRSVIADHVSADALSFMNESRRLDNRRMKSVLRLRLRYPTVREGLAHEHAIGVD